MDSGFFCEIYFLGSHADLITILKSRAGISHFLLKYLHFFLKKTLFSGTSLNL